MSQLSDLPDIHCICCGLETNPINSDEYSSWYYCLFCGRSDTRRRSDESFLYSLSFFCCFPFFSTAYYQEKHSDGYQREAVNCCMIPCCIDCIETRTSCQCDCTFVCCDTRTCYQQDLTPNPQGESQHLIEKSEENMD